MHRFATKIHHHCSPPHFFFGYLLGAKKENPSYRNPTFIRTSPFLFLFWREDIPNNSKDFHKLFWILQDIQSCLFLYYFLELKVFGYNELLMFWQFIHHKFHVNSVKGIFIFRKKKYFFFREILKTISYTKKIGLFSKLF